MDAPTPSSDEPRPPAPTLAEPVAPSRQSVRWGRVVVVGVPAFLCGVAIAAYQPIVGAVVRHQAEALGVDLDWEAIDPALGSVRFSRARLKLSGVPGVKATAASLRVTTRWLSVTSIEADGVAVTIEGPAGERVLDLASWSSEHAGTYRLHGSATAVRLDWRARPDAPAWLTMTGGSITADGTTARLTTTATTAFGVPLGAVGATMAVESSGVTIEAGKRTGSEAPVVAKLSPSAKPPTLALTLRAVEVSALGTALGLSLPAAGAVASGKADLTLARTGITGTASLDLDGWVPPHPRALAGIVTGKKTTIRSRLRLSEDRATLNLDDLEVRAGRLDLKGSGTVADAARHVSVHLDLSGPIPCADLARAVGQELGGLLGGIAADLGGGMVGGSATLSVSVDADPHDLGSAKVKPRVGVGCGLKLPGL